MTNEVLHKHFVPYFDQGLPVLCPQHPLHKIFLIIALPSQLLLAQFQQTPNQSVKSGQG